MPAGSLPGRAQFEAVKFSLKVESDRHTMKLTKLAVVLALVCCATAQTTRFPILNITIGEPLPELRLLSGNVELDMLPAHFMVR